MSITNKSTVKKSAKLKKHYQYIWISKKKYTNMLKLYSSPKELQNKIELRDLMIKDWLRFHEIFTDLYFEYSNWLISILADYEMKFSKQILKINERIKSINKQHRILLNDSIKCEKPQSKSFWAFESLDSNQSIFNDKTFKKTKINKIEVMRIK